MSERASPGPWPSLHPRSPSPLWWLLQRGSAAWDSSSRSAVLCGGNSSCNLARSPVYRAFCKAMSWHSSGDRRVGSQAGRDWDPQTRQAGAEGRHPRRRPQWGGELLPPGIANLWERGSQRSGTRESATGRLVRQALGPSQAEAECGRGRGAHIGHAANSPAVLAVSPRAGGLRLEWALGRSWRTE